MRGTRILLQHKLRLTLFTRESCGLCTQAKDVLARVWDRRHFEYSEVDVMLPEQKKWHDLYVFDVPVLHIEQNTETEATTSVVAETQRLMHRFTEQQVEDAMDKAENP